jgi:hypothetical protein
MYKIKNNKMSLVKNMKYFIVFFLIPFITLASEDNGYTIKKHEPLSKEKRITTTVEFGNGYLEIGKASSNNAYELELIYQQNKPQIEYDLIGKEARLDIWFTGKVHRDDQEDSHNVSSLKKIYDNELYMLLNPDIPIEMDLELGVVKGVIDLRGMKVPEIDLEVGVGNLQIKNIGDSHLEDLSFEGGVGKFELDFSGKFKNDMRVDIEIGAGKTVLYLPRKTGTKIELNKSFFSSCSIDDVYKKGDVYYNDSWDKTEHRLEIYIETGIGKIEINWLED